jgi:hypothetical protein
MFHVKHRPRGRGSMFHVKHGHEAGTILLPRPGQCQVPFDGLGPPGNAFSPIPDDLLHNRPDFGHDRARIGLRISQRALTSKGRTMPSKTAPSIPPEPLAGRLAGARRVLVLTGAGNSAETGAGFGGRDVLNICLHSQLGAATEGLGGNVDRGEPGPERLDASRRCGLSCPGWSGTIGVNPLYWNHIDANSTLCLNE